MKYALEDFISEINNLLGGDGSSFWECEKPFKRILATNELLDIVNHELSKAREDYTYHSPRWLESGLVLHSEPNWVLMYSLYEHTPAHLYTLPFHGLVSPSPGQKIEYDVYELPSTYNNLVFDRGMRLGERQSFVARGGDIVQLDAKRMVFDPQVKEPTAAIRLYTSTLDPLQWAFDRSTLQPIQAISSAEVNTELVVVAQVLAMLKDKRSLDLLHRLAKEHHHHHVRWESVKAIAQIDFEAGLQAVKNALSDLHPHVVSAAQRTLQRHNAELSANQA